MKKETVLKKNTIALARHHKKYCEGEKCTISLILLMELLRLSGIKLTKQEVEEFI